MVVIKGVLIKSFITDSEWDDEDISADDRS